MEPTEPKLTVSPEGYQQALNLLIAEDPMTTPELARIRNRQLRECVRAASQLLQKSEKFKAIVRRLNGEYVSAVALENFTPDEDGVLSTGRFSGRRTLAFGNLMSDGNRFLRAGSHEIKGSAFLLSDWILLEPSFVPPEFREDPDEKPEDAELFRETNRMRRGKCIAEFVGLIAHETVHAFNRVTAKATAPSLSRKQRAAAFIKEEIDTREKEIEILDQLRKTVNVLEKAEKETNSQGLRKRIDNQVATTKLAPWAVERDFVSGTSLTYLELFVNNLLVSESIEKGGIRSSEVRENKELVGRLKFLGSLEKVMQSKFPERLTQDPETKFLTTSLPEIGDLLLVRRIIEEHWKERDLDADFEVFLQRHREAFFPKEISYTPLP